MTVRVFRWFGLTSLGGAVAMATALSVRPVNGQDGPRRAEAPNERAERLEEMALIARSIKVFDVEPNGVDKPTEMAAEPLHRWTDPTREFSDGGLWVWRKGGRPIAVVGIELYTYWSLEFVSLSDKPARGEYDPAGVRWTPGKAGAEFRDIPEAPKPASGEAGRIRQMRELARQFAANEYWEAKAQNYALRLLPRPIDRYADPQAGLVDGGLFLFAHGTNPEIVLMIEARRQGNEPARWMFAAMPLSHAKVDLKVGMKEVWNSPSKDSGFRITPTDPYYDVLVPRRIGEVRNGDRNPQKIDRNP
jgi:hypothetical protein